jgi:hypothetical protein
LRRSNVPRAAFFLVIVSLLLASSCAGCLAVHDSGNVVVGSIRTSDGKPLEGVRVRFLKPFATEPFVSDSTGCFAVHVMYEDNGSGKPDVVVEFEKAGYKTWQYRPRSNEYCVVDVALVKTDEAAPGRADTRALVPEDKPRYPCSYRVLQ